MMRNCSFKIERLLLAVVVFTVFFSVRCQIYKHSMRSFLEAEQALTHQTSNEARYLQEGSNNSEVSTYGPSYADGCLDGIPIPNKTLDETFTPEQEKAVLMEIFQKTDGYNWKNKTHWGNHSMSHCFWYGITCDETTRYVVSIFLSSNNLTGSLPGSLWILRNLLCLKISNNGGLIGNMSKILSANMTNVLHVDLGFNRLYGRIPGGSLVQMKSLVKIQLCCQVGEERPFGEIPEDIGNLENLEFLRLGHCKLTGSVPKSIGKLQKLWYLDLEFANYLHGGFAHFFNLTSLRYMHLSYAGLRGTLPDNFGLLFPNMIECALDGNNFIGRMPSTIGKMTKLKKLNLANNSFSGQIPLSIGLLPVLEVADFSGNDLNSFEKGLKFKSPSLEVLDVAGNKQLNTSLEAFLEIMEPLRKLRIFNIRGCDFHGAIPKELWEYFQNLISVDLSGNRLSEEIPSPSIQGMVFLSQLNVSSNHLTGEIPHISTASLEVLDVSDDPHMREAYENGPLPNFIKTDSASFTYNDSSNKWLKCPSLRLTNNNGLVIVDPSYYRHRLCVCDVGYYGSGKTCLPCMEGAECKDQKLLTQNMVIKVGHWPSPSDQNVTHLVKCSQALGISPNEKTSCNPTGACECWVREGSTSTVCNNSCLCRDGSKDRFCSHCEDGYYKQGSLCYPCPKEKASVYIFVALGFFTLAFLTLALTVFYAKKRFLSILFAMAQILLLAVLVLLYIIPSWLFELNVLALIVGLSGRGKAARGILKIGIFYFQTLDALISSSNVWPYEVFETQRYISSVFNFRLYGFACVVPCLYTPLGELLSVIFMPLICIMGIWLYFGLGYAALKLRHSLNRLSRLRNSCLQLSVLILNLTYFPVVKKTSAVLAPCREDSGYHYLVEAPWMECDGIMYTMLQVFGWLAFVLYVIGIPFGLFLPLLRMKVAKRDHLSPDEQETLDSWLGSIYLPYKKKFRSYFEILFLLKRMLIAFSLSLVPRASSFQTIAVCSVLLTSLCFQLLLKPFADSYQKIPVENAAETLVLLTLNFSFMNTRYAALDVKSSLYITWMVVGVNGVLLCGMIFCIILLLGRSHTVQISPPVPGNEENKESVSEGFTDAPTIPLIENYPEEQYGSLAESRAMGKDVTGT